MTLDVLNNSLGLNLASIDIEACHVVPSKQKDGKRVTVCRFLSCKVKDSVFAAKKGKRDIKYSGNNIYINEQLNPGSRKIFNMASAKKRELNWKFIWTKNGVVFLRKDEQSNIIKCTEESSLNSIT